MLSFQKSGACVFASRAVICFSLASMSKIPPEGDDLLLVLLQFQSVVFQHMPYKVIFSWMSIVMRSIAVESVFPWASSFRETVPPPPRLL